MSNQFETDSGPVSEGMTTLTSRIAYENRWLRIREDTIRRRDGSFGLFGIVERHDFVVVVALVAGSIVLVEQYRYPVKQRLWELPMGAWETPTSADPALLAAQELQEETGLIAKSLQHVGQLLQAPGFCDQRGHIYLATDCEQIGHAREPSEQDMICRHFPVLQVQQMVCQGLVSDALSVAVIGMLTLKNLI